MKLVTINLTLNSTNTIFINRFNFLYYNHNNISMLPVLMKILGRFAVIKASTDCKE